MSAFIVLALAIVSRILPLSFHTAGLNFTAVGAGLLFFGARRSRWQTIIPVAALMSCDFYLTVLKYHMSFHVAEYVMTWAWYAALCLIAHGLLQRVTVLRVAAGVLTSALGFYLISDFPLWLFGSLYPHTLAGLVDCYVAALPFLLNDLLSTMIGAAVLFGAPVLAARLLHSEAGQRVA
jgi:hypothetical protein